MVTSLLTEKGRELVKEFEGDARTIISKLHHYHTQSNVAQHEVDTHQRYVFARANQSTNHLVDRGANGGLAGADTRVLQKQQLG